MTDLLDPLRRLSESLTDEAQRAKARQVVADTLMVTARLAAGDPTAEADLRMLQSQGASLIGAAASHTSDAIIDMVVAVMTRVLPPGA